MECVNKEVFPESMAVKIWTNWAGLKLIIVYSGHYCGYVRFPKRPVRESGYNGFMTYVPVHGGITFAEGDKDGFVYGFDCAHCDDWAEYSPHGHKWTEDEVVMETEKLANNILKAVKWEKRYLAKYSRKGRYEGKNTNKDKAKIIDLYHREVGEFKLSENFGAMINLLCGRL